MAEYLDVIAGGERAELKIKELEQKLKDAGLTQKFSREYMNKVCGSMGDIAYFTGMYRQYRLYELEQEMKK